MERMKSLLEVPEASPSVSTAEQPFSAADVLAAPASFSAAGGGSKGLSHWLTSLRRMRARWEQLMVAKTKVAKAKESIPVLSVRSSYNNIFMVLYEPKNGSILT